jgi:alpha-tubulin suppressor-like RCC1 family protein
MRNKLNVLSVGFAIALFSGVLINSSPITVSAYEDFIVDLHDETFLKVESGQHFTIVLSSNNEVFTFGRNNRGQLGNGTTNESLSVFNITDSFNLNVGETVEDIDAGWGFTVAVTSDNRVFAWGDPDVVQLAKGSVSVLPQTTPFDLTSALNPTNAIVRKISAGDSNIMVWTDSNVVRMAGANNFGQLGQGNTTSTPGAVSVNWSTLLNDEVLKDVGIFAQTAYALTESGKVLAWGDNANKQVGNNGPTNVTSPSQISFPDLSGDEEIVSASIGVNHGVAVSNEYRVFFWGTNGNAAVGDTETLPLGTVKNTPFDATEAFIYTNEFNDYLDGFAINYDRDISTNEIYSAYVARPLEVIALNDATVFKSEEFRQNYENGNPAAIDYIQIYYQVIGLNTYDGNDYVLDSTMEEELDYLPELEYADYNVYYYYNDEEGIIDLGFSRTHSIWLNTDGDFTIFGSNEFGEHGVGYTSEGGEEWNYNYSINVRDFIDYIYAYLPTNLTAPLDPYFNPAGGPSSGVIAEQEAIFGYWRGFNSDIREPGIVDYFFPESFFGELFSEKEWSLITAEQMTVMQQIIATVFEDEIVYESYIRTDELILEVLDDDGREAADWLRYDMEYYSNYGSYELGWDEELYLTDGIIDLLPSSVETRLNRYRELLAAVEGFEDTYLQPFLALMEDETDDVNLDIDFVYFDDYYKENALDLDYEQMEYLIDNEYESMILNIFTAYEALPELVQLLINEWNFYGIYEELYYAYYDFFADDYAEALLQFENDVQEGDWEWYWPLFENLSELETLLAGIDNLNEISYDLFVEMFGQDDEFFSYGMYEYWIWLNDLLPLLQEGKDVYDQIVIIEDLIQNDDDYEYVNLEDVAAILDMYADFLLLSNEAQDLLDPENVYLIYSLALEALANEVEDLGWDIYDIEDESGTYGLFANYDDVLAALAKFEALPEDALEYLSDDAIDYYEYLMSIKLSLEEGLDVFDQIMDIEDMDLDNLDVTTIEAILDMYQDYLALSEDAQDLLNPDYVQWLLSLIIDQVEGDIEELPGTVEDFDALFNDAETKDTTVNSLLGAWNKYQAMSDDLKDDMDQEARAHLEALYARYLELNKTSVDLWMVGLIIVHLSAGVYFAFKKRDILVKPVQ